MANYYTEQKPEGLKPNQWYSASGKIYDEFTGSNLQPGVMFGLGSASFATDVLSSYMQIGEAEDKASAYKFKAERSKMAGEMAMLQTKLNNANLMAQYNETQANANLIAAIQGRSGATVENIARVDAENLAWDMEFMKQTGIIQKAGYDIEAAGYRSAAATTTKTGYQKAALGMLGSLANVAKVV